MVAAVGHMHTIRLTSMVLRGMERRTFLHGLLRSRPVEQRQRQRQHYGHSHTCLHLADNEVAVEDGRSEDRLVGSIPAAGGAAGA